ncbi:MAG: hypothetical protein GWO07_01855 [Candidatus Dadabacteria bacterium]|nr:hypothetical protein [Candidatus Dadabacteria bacterium]NIV41726.1 hypothetical protein [Candidatus Dadabacteria bacterium]NIX15190.1 hypothetical protein [Candidatus Dadabacteria bacterium]
MENGYAELDFPFTKISAPPFSMDAEWALDHLTGYLNTWTGVQNYIEIECFSPLEFIEGELKVLWGDEKSKKKINWPLTVIVGKKQ